VAALSEQNISQAPYFENSLFLFNSYSKTAINSLASGWFRGFSEKNA